MHSAGTGIGSAALAVGDGIGGAVHSVGNGIGGVATGIGGVATGLGNAATGLGNAATGLGSGIGGVATGIGGLLGDFAHDTDSGELPPRNLFGPTKEVRRPQDEEDERKRRKRDKFSDTFFGRIAKSEYFERATIGVIMLNAVEIGWDADYSARFHKPDEDDDGLSEAGGLEEGSARWGPALSGLRQGDVGQLARGRRTLRKRDRRIRLCVPRGALNSIC
eukprot:CAMPEP_0177459090 /NCGR_PEP_ID=MMETSP0369-20130122/13906_1 /TAXON_ID=447022 ORGANISM="Scrippsiella hangoei-like, Strain SHHI-4" /NCGR_SAMPLE_ID=MMETSP0369 /ASSEMBLY_ACC=CAM_ASM_000364 /LENGTH=219 /DNA_ID=CAMNT_0018932307 /DNA_START=174 /DNA_END=833 /DNA_ORIENTATION=+